MSTFNARVRSLYGSMRSRVRERRDKNNHVIRKGGEIPFTHDEFKAWLIKQFGTEQGVIRCRYCRRPVDVFSCAVDHEVPLKRGGSLGLSNLGLPCVPCNDAKSGLTAEEFAWFLERMQEMGQKFGAVSVTDITSRLEKAVRLAASLRFNIARRQKEAVRAAVAEDDF